MVSETRTIYTCRLYKGFSSKFYDVYLDRQDLEGDNGQNIVLIAIKIRTTSSM